METDKPVLCESLVIWLQTFNTAAPCMTVEELTTGAAISQALHQIDPAWFSESWLGRIKEDVGDNWRLKVLNCTSLFLSVLSQQIQEFPLPDLVKVAEHSDPLMSNENMAQFGAEPPGDVESQLTLEDLEQEVTVLQEERNSLLAENDALTGRANQLDSFDDPSTPSGRKHSQLQIQLETLQEENFRLEAAKDDYRIHCEELEKQLIEVQHRNDELTSLAEESRVLKDELDILRSCSDRAVKLEASVETYRRKLEDLGDLRRQVKLLEEKNMTYMHNTVDLEEELCKDNAARTQPETYKRQVQELHRKLSEESRRSDNLAYEKKKFEEKHDAVMKEKERIIIERDSLKKTNEELRCNQAQQDQLLQAAGSPSHDNLAAEILPVEYREKFIRLQHENKILRVQQEGSENEKISELQILLEVAHRTRSELDTENRLSRKRVTELQQQVEDLQKTLQGQGAKTDDDEIMKKKELLEDLQPDNTQTSLRLDELMAALKKKDDDMRAMEERYKMYLEKARNLNLATAEIQALKNQLTDRDEDPQPGRECEQAKLKVYEEKLIVTAWYNKSLSFQKLAIKARLGGRSTSMVPPAQSFLTQQHQVTNATRRTLSVSMPATTTK
ncbi:unnamed protein product [Coregonus sp. 'balchen']|nr:unnamed protein product [Coregonus sp. 'balchen']